MKLARFLGSTGCGLALLACGSSSGGPPADAGVDEPDPPRICGSNALDCKGADNNELVRCNEAGTSFSPVATCANVTSCVLSRDKLADHCLVCDPDKVACNGNHLETCAADGSAI